MPDRMKMRNSITLNNNYGISKITVFSNLDIPLPHTCPWNTYDETSWNSNTNLKNRHYKIFTDLK